MSPTAKKRNNFLQLHEVSDEHSTPPTKTFTFERKLDKLSTNSENEDISEELVNP